MGFQESSETIQSKLHLGGVKPLWLIIALMAFAALVALGLNFVVSMAEGHSFSVSKEADLEAPEDRVDPAPEISEADKELEVSLLCVHVSGCVEVPGVYYLEEGSRVHDAIRLAGGMSDEAFEGYVNEARVLQDGEHLIIPSKDDIASQGVNGDIPAFHLAESDTQGQNGLVNINTADSEELQRLDGVGEATARKIIEERESNGPFESIEEIQRVSGIGEKKYESLREKICV